MLLLRFRPTSSSIAVRTCTARPFEPQPAFYKIVTPSKVSELNSGYHFCENYRYVFGKKVLKGTKHSLWNFLVIYFHDFGSY